MSRWSRVTGDSNADGSGERGVGGAEIRGFTVYLISDSPTKYVPDPQNQGNFILQPRNDPPVVVHEISRL